MAAYDQKITEAAEGKKTFRNDTFTLRFTVRDGPSSSDSATDITGYTFTYKLEDENGAEVVKKTSAGGGVSITDAANGLVEASIAKDELDSSGHHYWELEGESGSGQRKTTADGEWYINEDLITS